MIEQNAATAENVITLAVIDRHPVRVQLGCTIGAARVERCGFVLRHCLHFAKHFRGGRLVKSDSLVHDADCFQQIDRAQPGNLGRRDRLFE